MGKHIQIPNYEPKKQNRFVVTLPETFDLKEWTIRSIDLPSFDMFSGWKPMNIQFVDPICPSTSQRLWNLYCAITKTKDVLIPDYDNLCTLVDEGFEIGIELIDPAGKVVSVWKLSGCKIVEMDWGSLDYAESDVLRCGMKIKPR